MLQDMCEVGPCVMAKGKAQRFGCHTKEIIAGKERCMLDGTRRVLLRVTYDSQIIWMWGNGQLGLQRSLPTPAMPLSAVP